MHGEVRTMMLPLLLTFSILHGCDMATTATVLNRGGVELNVLPNNSALNLTIHAAEATAIGAGMVALDRAGHHKAARWVLVASIALEGYAVAHNLQQIRR